MWNSSQDHASLVKWSGAFETDDFPPSIEIVMLRRLSAQPSLKK